MNQENTVAAKINRMFAKASVQKTDGFRYIVTPKTKEVLEFSKKLEADCLALISAMSSEEKIELQLNATVLNSLNSDPYSEPLAELIRHKLEKN